MVGGSREKSFPWLLVGCLCVLAAAPASAFDEAAADRVLLHAQQKLRATATNSAIPTTQYPKATTNGPWRTVANTARIDWVQGFFPGQLWFMYDHVKDPFWRSRADAWTRNLELQKEHPDIRQITHDLGFKFMTSFGHAYRLTGDDYYRQVMITAAGSLARRYNPTVGVIDCCDWNDSVWQVPMVTDTMMDLELLFWGARNGGNPAWNDMALSHALKTLTDMVRADGGTFHVVDYNTSGGIRSRGTFQGYSDSSTWSRGQAWAIYGFTMAYRYTRDTRMLQGAVRTAEYYLARLPADSIPNWDFNAPADQQQKDSSAAAIVASALQELSLYVSDPAVAQRYRNAALAMLDSLSSPTYLTPATSASPGLLLHGTAFYKTAIKPSGEDIDKTLIYGDYYFVEAVLRFKRLTPGSWFSSISFSGSVRNLGAANTGIQVVEFDVTPFSNTVDGVVGYADSSTIVTGYGSLPMTIRMNPAGFFDVRRGDTFAALVNLPYQANTTYHVRMRTDLNAKVYSVWVTPPGGSEVLLAERFVFRTGAPAIDDLGKVSLRSVRFDYDFRASNHTVRPEGAPPPVEWFSTTDFSRSVHDLGTGNTGVREVVFDVTPARRPIDAVVGYADSSVTVTGYSVLAMTIRMNPEGFFDVRRGGAFAALTSLPYLANTTYRVRMRTDLNAKVYSVWITPPGGNEVLLADSFAFRTGAPLTDDLGKVSLRSIAADGDFKVAGHSVRSVMSITSAGLGDPDLPAPEALGTAVSEEESLGGCAAAPGSALAMAGVLLVLLGAGRRSRRQS
ncbi:glycoside hydrolase family 88 protein [Archangium lansingense]|uniref:glycoside hydrolase family 88 protein n=1 Tax=Archangium lansingense TaxID=2995310 RepID=UPI003B768F99